MKYKDLKFTDKQVKRILAEAAEREARDSEEDDKTIDYSQLVQIAQESMIDPKYLKVSTKQLVKETGSLEKIAVGRMLGKTRYFYNNFLEGLLKAYFILPTHLRRMDDEESITAPKICGTIAGALSYFSSLATLIFPYQHGSIFSQETEFYMTIGGALGALTQIGSGFYEWYRYEQNKILKEMNGDEKNQK